ncbi:Glutelin type-b, partial [Thalictrum thalictroides]
NALLAPRWNLNAHSVIYATRGDAEVEIVGNNQQPIYSGRLRQNQLLIVPQNFAVVIKAGDQGFEWVSFKTNDNAIVNSIAGRNSVFQALPEGVLRNAFRISSEEAKQLKNNREEERELFEPRFESQKREYASA